MMRWRECLKGVTGVAVIVIVMGYMSCWGDGMVFVWLEVGLMMRLYDWIEGWEAWSIRHCHV